MWAKPLLGSPQTFAATLIACVKLNNEKIVSATNGLSDQKSVWMFATVAHDRNEETSARYN
jgi:hypothetical protein